MRTTRQTQDQDRARFALEKIRELRSDLLSEYRDLVRRFPSMVLESGLGQTLAFLLSKGTQKGQPNRDSEHWRLYEHMQEWLCDKKRIFPGTDEGDDFRLIRRLVETDSVRYRWGVREALALGAWLKRFAEAFSPESEEGS